MPQAAQKRTAADPETSAIAKIGKLVMELPEPARKRVLKYVHERYCESSQSGLGQTQA